MKNNQILGLVGSLILLFGTFTPLISFPIMGTLNYVNNGRGDGVIIIIISVISLTLVLINKCKYLLVTSIASIFIMLATFINFQMRISTLKTKMETDLAGNPFRGLADIAINSIQLQWGWGVLIAGVILLIVASVIKEE